MKIKIYPVFVLSILLFFMGCSSKKWEYKVVEYYGDNLSRTGQEAFKANTIKLNESEFDKLGQDGWELISTYIENETAYPNFGNSEYVTGLQANIRPQKLVCIFKR